MFYSTLGLPPVPSGSKLKKLIANLLRSMLMSPVDREFFYANRRGKLAGQKAVEQLKRSAASGVPPAGAPQES
jgi:hypothetical protein